MRRKSNGHRRGGKAAPVRFLPKWRSAERHEESVSAVCPACYTELDKVGESLVARGNAPNEFLRRGLEKESV
jgi:hypothetical protein